MKKSALVMLLAMMGMISGHAAPSRANDGDVLLGFSKEGSAINYTVNLGSRANFITNFNVMLSDIRTDLSSIYGLASLEGLRFGGVSGMYDDNSIYATVAAGTTGWTPESVGSYNGQNYAVSKILALAANYNRYLNQQEAGTIGLAGVKVSTADEDSWTSLHSSSSSSGAPFDHFGGSLEGNFIDGVTFYSLDPANGVGSNAAPIQGGTLSNVPEPSTYALFGFASLLLIVAYRRRTNA
jgi:hypothetical protein